MGVKIDKKVIEDRLKGIFPNYTFDLTDYTNTHCKIPVICPIHGESNQIVKNLLNGHGCNKCGESKSSDKQKLNFNDIINRFRDKHGDKYDYSNFNYINNREPSIIICPNHGPFKQSAWVHSKGHGCPACSNNKKLTKQEFIKRSNNIHNIEYNYDLIDYKNMHNKVKIVCPVHGEFNQLALHHIKGVGCPKCSQSKGERMIENYLKNNQIEYESQKKFDDCLYKTNLVFDFYLPKYNTCIEYNGIQHYTSIDIFGGDDALKLNKLRDSIKVEYCKKNNINLIIIKQDKKHMNLSDVEYQINNISKHLNIKESFILTFNTFEIKIR